MRLARNPLEAKRSPKTPNRSYGMGVPRGHLPPDDTRMLAPSGERVFMVSAETAKVLSRIGWSYVKARRRNAA